MLHNIFYQGSLAMVSIQTKRIYEPATAFDGTRILVDRLWPRGLSKEKAKLSYWAKSIAPSTKLRQLFHQNRCSREQFKKYYFAELDENKEALTELKTYFFQNEVVTFLFSSKEMEFNHAVVLKEYIEHHSNNPLFFH